MSNPEKNYKGCGVVILALFLLSVATNVWLIKRGQVEPEPQVVIEHDTLWRDTTITKPVAADSTKTGEVVYIRIPYPPPAVRGQSPGRILPRYSPQTASRCRYLSSRSDTKTRSTRRGCRDSGRHSIRYDCISRR